MIRKGVIGRSEIVLPHRTALQRLIAAARELSWVAALGAYGTTATQSWSDHSDLDLIMILEHGAPVNSIHFFFEGIPVDLNLKSRDSWEAGDYGWLPPGEVIGVWDPDGLFATIQSSTETTSDAGQYRYAHRHRLLKLAKWIGRDDDIADLLAAGATHWIAVSWFHARNLRFPGIDQAVMHWRTHQPEMIELLTGAARDRRSRYERIAEASALALEPVGGLWGEEELHVTGWHGSPSQTDIASARLLLEQLLDTADVPASGTLEVPLKGDSDG